VHFQQGSVGITPGQQVQRGMRLGLVGNSGRSGWPHLHIGLWRQGEGQISLPLAFERVRVSLNPGPDDPWSRELEIWEIREGREEGLKEVEERVKSYLPDEVEGTT
jgi:hypothetical protein